MSAFALVLLLVWYAVYGQTHVHHRAPESKPFPLIVQKSAVRNLLTACSSTICKLDININLLVNVKVSVDNRVNADSNLKLLTKLYLLSHGFGHDNVLCRL